MQREKILRIILVSFIVLFIAWVSFFDQSLQLRYKNITLISLCLFFSLAFLYRKGIRFSEADIALFIYLFAVSLSVIFSEQRSVALEWYRIYILPIPLIYLIFRNIGRSFILPIAKGIFIASTIVALFGILEIIFHKNIIYESWIENAYYDRFNIYQIRGITSTLMHPTIFGSYLLGCLPFAFFLIPETKGYRRGLIILCILIMLTGVILSCSRGNLAALAGLSICYLFLIKKRRYIKYILICPIVLVIAITTFDQNYRDYKNSQGIIMIQEMFYFNRYSLTSLVHPIWFLRKVDRSRRTFAILKEYPLLGAGLNHFRLIFDRYNSPEQKERKKRRVGRGPEFKVPDNMYLSILAETGGVGFLSFMLFLLLLFKRGLRRLKGIKDNKEKHFLICCMSGVIALLISMNTYDLLYWINPFLLFWFLIGLISSAVTIK